MRSTLVSLICLLLSAPAFAADVRHDTIRHTSAASEHSYGSLKGVGLADTENVTGGEALSGLFSNNQDWIQVLAAIYQTKGAFSFAVGGAYKFTVAGTRSTGFHVGPGFTVGTIADAFAFAIFGTAGGHFTIADHLMVSVDGGPMVTHTENNTNFRLRGLGQILGLAVHYVF